MKFHSSIAMTVRLVLATAITFGSVTAAAQDAPIRLLVGFPAGGSSDLIARQLAVGMQSELGRTVVVENRAGAGGQIAAQVAKAAKPDGNTLFLSSSHTMSLIPLTVSNPGFDPAKDFAPVGLVTTNPDVFAVNASVVGAGSDGFKDFVKWVQAKAGRGNVGVPAPASAPEFAVNLIGRSQNVELTAVPYRGDGPLVQDLVAGQLASGIGGVSAVLPYVETGKLRILAVNGSQRIARLPNVPTYAELGIKGLEEIIFTAVFAPIGTSSALIQKYNAAISKVAGSATFSEKIGSLGVIATPSSPEELERRLEASRLAYSRLVKDAGYKPQ